MNSERLLIHSDVDGVPSDRIASPLPVRSVERVSGLPVTPNLLLFDSNTADKLPPQIKRALIDSSLSSQGAKTLLSNKPLAVETVRAIWDIYREASEEERDIIRPKLISFFKSLGLIEVEEQEGQIQIRPNVSTVASLGDTSLALNFAPVVMPELRRGSPSLPPSMSSLDQTRGLLFLWDESLGLGREIRAEILRRVREENYLLSEPMSGAKAIEMTAESSSFNSETALEILVSLYKNYGLEKKVSPILSQSLARLDETHLEWRENPAWLKLVREDGRIDPDIFSKVAFDAYKISVGKGMSVESKPVEELPDWEEEGIFSPEEIEIFREKYQTLLPAAQREVERIRRRMMEEGPRERFSDRLCRVYSRDELKVLFSYKRMMKLDYYTGNLHLEKDGRLVSGEEGFDVLLDSLTEVDQGNFKKWIQERSKLVGSCNIPSADCLLYQTAREKYGSKSMGNVRIFDLINAYPDTDRLFRDTALLDQEGRIDQKRMDEGKKEFKEREIPTLRAIGRAFPEFAQLADILEKELPKSRNYQEAFFKARQQLGSEFWQIATLIDRAVYTLNYYYRVTGRFWPREDQIQVIKDEGFSGDQINGHGLLNPVILAERRLAGTVPYGTPEEPLKLPLTGNKITGPNAGGKSRMLQAVVHLLALPELPTCVTEDALIRLINPPEAECVNPALYFPPRKDLSGWQNRARVVHKALFGGGGYLDEIGETSPAHVAAIQAGVHLVDPEMTSITHAGLAVAKLQKLFEGRTEPRKWTFVENYSPKDKRLALTSGGVDLFARLVMPEDVLSALQANAASEGLACVVPEVYFKIARILEEIIPKEEIFCERADLEAIGLHDKEGGIFPLMFAALEERLEQEYVGTLKPRQILKILLSSDRRLAEQKADLPRLWYALGAAEVSRAEADFGEKFYSRVSQPRDRRREGRFEVLMKGDIDSYLQMLSFLSSGLGVALGEPQTIFLQLTASGLAPDTKAMGEFINSLSPHLSTSQKEILEKIAQIPSIFETLGKTPFEDLLTDSIVGKFQQRAKEFLDNCFARLAQTFSLTDEERQMLSQISTLTKDIEQLQGKEREIKDKRGKVSAEILAPGVHPLVKRNIQGLLSMFQRHVGFEQHFKQAIEDTLWGRRPGEFKKYFQLTSLYQYLLGTLVVPNEVGIPSILTEEFGVGFSEVLKTIDQWSNLGIFDAQGNVLKNLDDFKLEARLNEAKRQDESFRAYLEKNPQAREQVVRLVGNMTMWMLFDLHSEGLIEQISQNRITLKGSARETFDKMIFYRAGTKELADIGSQVRNKSKDLQALFQQGRRKRLFDKEKYIEKLRQLSSQSEIDKIRSVLKQAETTWKHLVDEKVLSEARYLLRFSHVTSSSARKYFIRACESSFFDNRNIAELPCLNFINQLNLRGYENPLLEKIARDVLSIIQQEECQKNLTGYTLDQLSEVKELCQDLLADLAYINLLKTLGVSTRRQTADSLSLKEAIHLGAVAMNIDISYDRERSIKDQIRWAVDSRNPDHFRPVTIDNNGKPVTEMFGLNAAGKTTTGRTLQIMTALGRYWPYLPARGFSSPDYQRVVRVTSSGTALDASAYTQSGVDVREGLWAGRSVSQKGKPHQILYILDEILSGTAGEHQRACSETTVENLVEYGGDVVVINHDPLFDEWLTRRFERDVARFGYKERFQLKSATKFMEPQSFRVMREMAPPERWPPETVKFFEFLYQILDEVQRRERELKSRG